MAVKIEAMLGILIGARMISNPDLASFLRRPIGKRFRDNAAAKLLADRRAFPFSGIQCVLLSETFLSPPCFCQQLSEPRFISRRKFFP